jgi:hypothetical protein
LYLDTAPKSLETIERPGCFLIYAKNVGVVLKFKTSNKNKSSVKHRFLMRSVVDANYRNKWVSFISDVTES